MIRTRGNSLQNSMISKADIVFCTVIGRAVDTYGSIDHLAFLIDLNDYLGSNPGKQYAIA